MLNKVLIIHKTVLKFEDVNLTSSPSVNEGDSMASMKPQAVLPRGFLQVPAADRYCGSLDRPTPSARRLLYFLHSAIYFNYPSTYTFAWFLQYMAFNC